MTQTRWLAAAIMTLTLAAGVAACVNRLPTVPPLGESGAELAGKVVWHDLVTPDLAGARAFYGELFGWSFESLSSGYTLVRNQGQPVAGMASLDDENRASHWLPLVSVPDVDRAVRLTTERGGRSILSPFELPSRGRVALVADPQGAVFGVVRSTGGDPPDRKAGMGDWIWHEVWTDDVAGSGRFYAELAGYTPKERQVFGTAYTYLSQGDHPRVGLVRKPDPEIGNTWVTYLRVADVASTAARAEALGGTLLMEPRAEVRNGTAAIVADPDGAGFIIQEWNR
jgi:predicted enzyme related to lactoylglutathione lyase